MLKSLAQKLRRLKFQRNNHPIRYLYLVTPLLCILEKNFLQAFVQIIKPENFTREMLLKFKKCYDCSAFYICKTIRKRNFSTHAIVI